MEDDGGPAARRESDVNPSARSRRRLAVFRRLHAENMGLAAQLTYPTRDSFRRLP